MHDDLLLFPLSSFLHFLAASRCRRRASSFSRRGRHREHGRIVSFFPFPHTFLLLSLTAQGRSRCQSLPFSVRESREGQDRVSPPPCSSPSAVRFFFLPIYSSAGTLPSFLHAGKETGDKPSFLSLDRTEIGNARDIVLLSPLCSPSR